MKNVITIDGFACSGKSSIACSLAKQLNLLHIDTGEIYRTVAFEAIRKRISTKDYKALSQLASEITEVKHSKAIHTEKIAKYASEISTLPEVRINLLQLQRDLALKSKLGAVVNGRDTGTIIFPNAKYKFFIIASIKERARRKYLENIEGTSAHAADLNAIINKIAFKLRERDKRDQNRIIAPMFPARDAIIIDTTCKSIKQTVEKIQEILTTRSQFRNYN